jgi:hypothetical protein
MKLCTLGKRHDDVADQQSHDNNERKFCLNIEM